jgi:Fe2+ or Zn2+ uptake regulation protein
MNNILKNAGYKVTPARVAILEIFSKSKNPLDAETIYKQLKKKHNNINEVTVYRTLTSFTESGILKRVDLRKNSTYFEFASEHHHHIVCTKCDTVEDIENKELEKVLGKIVNKLSKFKRIKEHSLEFFGLCVKCA